MIAECRDCIVLSQLPTVGEGKGGAVVRAGRLGRVTAGGRAGALLVGGTLANFPAFQLSGFLALWLVVGVARVGVQRSPDAYLREGVHQGC